MLKKSPYTPYIMTTLAAISMTLLCYPSIAAHLPKNFKFAATSVHLSQTTKKVSNRKNTNPSICYYVSSFRSWFCIPPFR